MSYILEALKKSEQERRRGEMPEISRFETSENEASAKHKLWPVIVVVLVLANVGLLIFWAPWKGSEAEPEVVKASQETDKSTPADASEADGQTKQESGSITVAPIKEPILAEPRKKTKPAPEPRPVPSREPRLAPEPQTAVKQPEPITITPSEPKPVSKPASVPHTSYLPQIQELPASVQERIPDMSFSSHMYSSEPRFRSIIINGRRLKEGQYLNDEIQVREITDKGVILGLGDTIFEVDVLGQWVN